MKSFVIEFGRCGWGATGGLVPELRLGCVRFWCSRLRLFDEFDRFRAALATALDELRKRP